LMDRAGLRAVMELGVALMAGGLLLAPLTTQPWHLYLTIGVMVGADSVCLGYTGQSLFLPNWFIRRRGLATGIAFAGVGTGSVILLPWVQRIIEQAGWRTACWTLGLLISGQALRQHLRHHHADLPRRGRRRSLGHRRSARSVRQLYRGICHRNWRQPGRRGDDLARLSGQGAGGSQAGCTSCHRPLPIRSRAPPPDRGRKTATFRDPMTAYRRSTRTRRCDFPVVILI
jgi:Major Facilitator Superfamily